MRRSIRHSGDDNTVADKRVSDVRYMDMGEGVAELPTIHREGAGGGRRGPRETELSKRVETIRQDPNAHGLWFRIANYGKGTSAASSGKSLSKRFTAEEGWEFKTRT